MCPDERGDRPLNKCKEESVEDPPYPLSGEAHCVRARKSHATELAWLASLFLGGGRGHRGLGGDADGQGLRGCDKRRSADPIADRRRPPRSRAVRSVPGAVNDRTVLVNGYQAWRLAS